MQNRRDCLSDDGRQREADSYRLEKHLRRDQVSLEIEKT